MKNNNTKPNIIFINVDQMRGDALSCAGHPDIETPYLDSLKIEGAMFKNAYSATPSCIAARAGILTGMDQKNHGRLGYKDGVPWTYETTLPGELTKAGYQTQGIGKMHFSPPRAQMGFQNVILHDGYLHYERKHGLNVMENDDYLPWLKDKLGFDADYIGTGMECNSWTVRPWHYEEQYHPTNWVVTESIDFLRKRDKDKPFFLWMSFVRPHSPLDPPKYYLDMYMNKDLKQPILGEWEKKTEPTNSLIHNATSGKLNKELSQKQLAGYYGLITHIDHQIGRFLQALFDYSLTSNTMIVFSSDHGDLLGDHNLFRKSYPYEGSTSVPFLIKYPQNWKFEKNQEVDNVVELRDIMPTILDAANIEIPKSVDGKSVLPILENANTDWREYIHGEHTIGNGSAHYIVTKNDKYIWFSQDGTEQYFDLKNDIKETKNLIDNQDYSNQITKLRNFLINELSDREEGFSDGEKLISGKDVSPILNFLKDN